MRVKLQKRYQCVAAIQDNLLYHFATMIYQTYEWLRKFGDDKIGLAVNKKHGMKHNEYICCSCGFVTDRDQNAVLITQNKIGGGGWLGL